MNTRDLPVVILGVTILYVAYLLQNGMLRVPFEGFQNAPVPLSAKPMPAPPMPAPPMPAPPMPAPPPPAPPPPVDAPPPMSAEMQQAPVPNQPQLQEISEKLKRIGNQIQELDSISQQLQQMSQPQPPMAPPKEGFQSYQNPYNSPSPSSQQAYEFRLGRRNLTDEVLGVMNT